MANEITVAEGTFIVLGTFSSNMFNEKNPRAGMIVNFHGYKGAKMQDMHIRFEACEKNKILFL
jgi:hypothetical protein